MHDCITSCSCRWPKIASQALSSFSPGALDPPTKGGIEIGKGSSKKTAYAYSPKV